jgi:hypothetical protein
MHRPPLEVADLVRATGDAFIKRSRKWISWKHVKVLLAIRALFLPNALFNGHRHIASRFGSKRQITCAKVTRAERIA